MLHNKDRCITNMFFPPTPPHPKENVFLTSCVIIRNLSSSSPPALFTSSITSSSSLSATQTSRRMMRAGLISASKPAHSQTPFSACAVLKAHQASNQVIRAHQNNLKLICVYKTNTIITLYYNNMSHSDFLVLFLWCYQRQTEMSCGYSRLLPCHSGSLFNLAECLQWIPNAIPQGMFYWLEFKQRHLACKTNV